jgi:hypothetical protein
MNHRRFASLALTALVTTVALAACSQAPAPRPIDTVMAFYGWALNNGAAVEKLEPRVVRDSAFRAIALDDTKLPQFKAKFMESGLFAPDFAMALDAYYNRRKSAIAKEPAIEDGPVLETEDMDMFFCAQEYEYTPEFVQGMRVVSESQTAEFSELELESPYEWKTHFWLKRVASKWLISGYCVFHVA